MDRVLGFLILLHALAIAPILSYGSSQNVDSPGTYVSEGGRGYHRLQHQKPRRVLFRDSVPKSSSNNSGSERAQNTRGSGGAVVPRKSSYNGDKGTIYFDVNASNYCQAGTLYFYDSVDGWTECRALNRTTGWSVSQKQQYPTNMSGRRTDGSPCRYRTRAAGSFSTVLPERWSSPITGTKKPDADKNWGPERALKLGKWYRIHGRTGLGDSPPLSLLEKEGGAAGCVVTSDSCMRKLLRNEAKLQRFKVI